LAVAVNQDGLTDEISCFANSALVLLHVDLPIAHT